MSDPDKEIAIMNGLYAQFPEEDQDDLNSVACEICCFACEGMKPEQETKDRARAVLKRYEISTDQADLDAVDVLIDAQFYNS